MKQYLIVGHYTFDWDDNVPTSFVLGLATEKEVRNTNYQIELLQWLLLSDQETLEKVIAYEINKVNFSKLWNYYDHRWSNLPGDIILFDGTEFPIISLEKKIKKLQTQNLPSYVASKRIARSISKQKRIPEDIEKEIQSYLSFGKKKTITKALKIQAKKYKVRLTLKRGNKRVYKTEKVLKKQIKNAVKRSKKYKKLTN
jgi:hypothetical protein